MSAYYNENDKYAAQWLRNLIAAGHLPDGVVDDRFPLAARLSTGMGQLRAYGNAIVPQVAAEFIRASLF